MIYKITLYIVRFILIVLNGFANYSGQEYLPKDNGYVLVAPHRSWIDPVMIAIAVYPQSLIFMAKQELFSWKPFAWFIKKLGAFPVNREKPGPSAIKHPVTMLKDEKKALVIFPTGTRYSDDIKGGAVTIARLAKVPILPVVYQGPLTLGDILKRKKMHVRIGQPIEVPQGKLSKEDLNQIDLVIKESFDQLDKEINPEYRYELPVKKAKNKK